MRYLWLPCFFVLAACSAAEAPQDGGVHVDAQETFDAARPDAAGLDGGGIDAAVPDAGLQALAPTLRAVAEPFTDEGWTPSIAIGVSSAGQRLTLGLGSLVPGSDAPVDERTVYEIGSVTKTFTGLLLAQMSESGEVTLDDEVQALLPQQVTVPSRDDQAITLEHLSTHFSGLPRLPTNLAPSDPLNPYADYDTSSLYAFLNGYTLPRVPGASFEYSNLAVGLLGHALTLRAGAPSLEALYAARIIAPLGLEDTSITLRTEQTSRLAPPYDADGAPSKNWDLGALAGAGALRSTTADMLTLGEAYLDQPAPLANAMALATAPRRVAGPGSQIGLGWFVAEVNGDVARLHDGGTGGYTTFFAFVPEREVVVVVLTNSANYVAGRLGSAVLLAVLGLPYDAPEARPEADLEPSALDRLTGTYRFDASTSLIVNRPDARLRAQITGQSAFTLYAQDSLRFYMRAVEADLVFEEDEAGTITHVSILQGGQTFTATRQ